MASDRVWPSNARDGEPWLIEGMAYAPSNDPRNRLAEPFEGYRRTFTEWRAEHSDQSLQEAIRNELKR